MAQCLCPSCGQLLSIPDSDVPLRLRCSNCSQVFETVPEAPSPAAPASPLVPPRGPISPLVPPDRVSPPLLGDSEAPFVVPDEVALPADAPGQPVAPAPPRERPRRAAEAQPTKSASPAPAKPKPAAASHRAEHRTAAGPSPSDALAAAAAAAPTPARPTAARAPVRPLKRKKSNPTALVFLIVSALVLCGAVAIVARSMLSGTSGLDQQANPNEQNVPALSYKPSYEIRPDKPKEKDGPTPQEPSGIPGQPKPPADPSDKPKPPTPQPQTRPEVEPGRPVDPAPKPRPTILAPNHPLVLAAGFAADGNLTTAMQIIQREKAKGPADPEYPVCSLLHGYVLLIQDDRPGAVGAFATAAKAPAGPGDALLYLGGCQLVDGNKEAAATLARAHEKMPGDRRAEYLLAMSLYAERDLTRCHQLLERVGQGEDDLAKLSARRAADVAAALQKVGALNDERSTLKAKVEDLAGRLTTAKAAIAEAEKKRDALKAEYDKERDVPYQEYRTKLKEILVIYERERPPESIRDSRRSEYERRLKAAEQHRDQAAVRAKQALEAQYEVIDKKYKPQADAASAELKAAQATHDDLSRERMNTHAMAERLAQKMSRELKDVPMDVLGDIRKHLPLTAQRVDELLANK